MTVDRRADVAADVAIVGGGPGGYVAALRAAGHGLRTVLIEAGHLGGTCLNVGCIPSKALTHVAEEAATAGTDLRLPWRSETVEALRSGVGHLCESSGVEIINGRATFRDGKSVDVVGDDGSTRKVSATNLVIATGSTPTELPVLPFGGKVISSDQAVSLGAAPKSLIVVGGGYIGVELGTAFAKLGSSVTIVEASAQILPAFEARISKPVIQRLGQLGVDVLTNTLANGVDDKGRVIAKSGDEEKLLEADSVLVAIGRSPRSSADGLDSLGLKMDGPFIAIDDRCQTSMSGVFAIGDVTGEPMLAHRAMAQGTLVGDVLAGKTRHWDDRVIPAVCFTDPEIFTAGVTAKEHGSDAIVGRFPFSASGRAMTLGQPEGMVQVVADADHVVVGVQAVGPRVAELSGEATLAIEMGATLEDLALTVRAHPTLSEAIQEAALAALGSGLHSV